MKSKAGWIGLLSLTQLPGNCWAAEQAKSRPNIIWLMAEDIGQDLECYGTKAVKTPVLNKLAEDGVRFTGLLAPNSICSPCRSAMMTGMHPLKINAQHHRSNRDVALPENVKPFTYWLRQAGYTCIHGSEFVMGGGRKTDCNFKHTELGAYDGVENFGLFDKLNVIQPQDQPFFAQIQLVATHRGDWWNSIREKSPHPVNPELVELPPYMADHPVIRLDWAKYLDQVEYIDREIGLIIDDLKKKGLYENTVIIFIGDNGRCNLRGKGYLYDPGVRVPLIMHWPSGLKGGAVRDDLLDLTDITATILDLAGAEIPASMTGRSFMRPDFYREYVFSARDVWDEITDKSRSLTARQYKYIRNDMPEKPWDAHQAYLEFYRPALHIMRRLKIEGALSEPQQLFFKATKPHEELYDLSVDPHELNNLAADPAFRAVLEKMRQQTLLEEQTMAPSRSVYEPADCTSSALYEYVKYMHPQAYLEMLNGVEIGFQKYLRIYRQWLRRHDSPKSNPAFPGKGRKPVKIDFDWRFKAGDIPGAESVEYNDTDWRVLDVPHDWSIEGSYAADNPSGGRCGYLPSGIVWYRKEIDFSNEWKNKKVSVGFDGVFMNSTVWLNGVKLGTRPYGYISFAYDLTPHLRPGKNILAVRVDNEQQPASRWYTGTGIYGRVHLTVTDPVHVNRGGIFFQTLEAAADHAVVSVDADVENGGEGTVTATLFSNDGKAVASRTVPLVDGRASQQLTVKNPELWSVDTPNLYTLRIAVEQGGEVVDQVDTRVGIRTLTFDKHTGFYLNGVSMKLKGVCEHHDGGPVGAAFPDKILRERLLLLKEMGCNAIRAAHNPRTPVFYDLCDELGLMVLDEIFDGWHKKAEADYGGRFFNQWWKTDVEEWVRANRNHPCIVMYSIGNETGEEDVHDITGWIKQFDATRPTTGGTLFKGVDIQGFNGPGEMPGAMQAFHEKFPDEICVRTEVPHTLQTRGFYRVRTWWRSKNDPHNEIPDYGTEQIFFDGHPRYSSSYDNCGVRMSARQSWRETRDMPWIIGEFRWTGFDYIGEASFAGGGWPARIWNYGVIDLAGLPKDHYWFYQSQWTTAPMVHILPHWTHPQLKPGTVVPVVGYSNCDEVELFLNGKSLGRKTEDAEWLEFVWQVPYEPGELKAVGYKHGKAVAEKVHRTAGAPAALRLETNNSDLKADRLDTATLTFSAADENGNGVPWAMNRVEFHIDGPVKHLGFENGDPVDVTPHRLHHRNLFYGFGRGFFQALENESPVRITAAAVLGDTRFEDTVQVAVDVQHIMLRGVPAAEQDTIRCTIDGSDPMLGTVYAGPFVLTASAEVRAVILRGGKPVLNLSQKFTKGAKPRVTDPRWDPAYSGSPINVWSGGYSGPFAEQLLGSWTAADETFEFRSDGVVYQGNDAVAVWWYEFPADIFEAGSDAGSGELLWKKTGEVFQLKLATQEAAELLLIKNGMKQKIMTR
jgi:beta-galactosidase